MSGNQKSSSSSASKGYGSTGYSSSGGFSNNNPSTGSMTTGSGGYSPTNTSPQTAGGGFSSGSVGSSSGGNDRGGSGNSSNSAATRSSSSSSAASSSVSASAADHIAGNDAASRLGGSITAGLGLYNSQPAPQPAQSFSSYNPAGNDFREQRSLRSSINTGPVSLASVPAIPSNPTPMLASTPPRQTYSGPKGIGQLTPAAYAAGEGAISWNPSEVAKITNKLGYTPVGIRANNPGNLLDASWERSLPGYTGPLKSPNGLTYASFSSPEYGLMAQSALISGPKYYGAGLTTINQIVDKYAPVDENNSAAANAGYKTHLAASLGVSPNAQLTKDQVASLGVNMASYENSGQALKTTHQGSGGSSLKVATPSFSIASAPKVASASPVKTNPFGVAIRQAPGYAGSTGATPMAPPPGYGDKPPVAADAFDSPTAMASKLLAGGYNQYRQAPGFTSPTPGYLNSNSATPDQVQPGYANNTSATPAAPKFSVARSQTDDAGSNQPAPTYAAPGYANNTSSFQMHAPVASQWDEKGFNQAAPVKMPGYLNSTGATPAPVSAAVASLPGDPLKPEDLEKNLATAVASNPTEIIKASPELQKVAAASPTFVQKLFADIAKGGKAGTKATDTLVAIISPPEAGISYDTTDLNAVFQALGQGRNPYKNGAKIA